MKTGVTNKRINGFIRLAVRIIVLFAVVWLTIIVVYAFQSRKKDDLKIWHKAELINEFKAAEYTEPEKKPYDLTVITNKDSSTTEIIAKTKTQGSTVFDTPIELDEQ